MSGTDSKINGNHRLGCLTGSTYDSPTPESISGTPIESIQDPSPVDETGSEDIDTYTPEPERLPATTLERILSEITTVATSITDRLHHNHTEELQAEIEEWCELHGFDPTDRQTIQLIARQAVFNLLLKSTLYEHYCQYNELPALTDNIRAALDQAESTTGNSVLSETVLDNIVWHVDKKDLDPVIEARYDFLNSDDPAEDIGYLYRELIPKDHRKVLSQFWTPRFHRLILRQWASLGQSTVLDPGLGAGRLSSQFHPLWTISTEPDYVYAVDRSPLALLMGSTALELSGQDHDPIEADFLSLSPNELSMDVDAVLCNPPFSRSEDISSTYKNRINRKMAKDFNVDLPKGAPLYPYFICNARRFLSPGDRAGFISPQDYLCTQYGESLKEFLCSKYHIKALIQFVDPADEVQFDEVQSTILLTLLEARADTDTLGMTRFIRVDETPDVATLQSAINDGSSGVTAWGAINRVAQANLDPTRNWQTLFEVSNEKTTLDPDDVNTSDLPRLGDFVNVKRGPSTGKAEFFCLKQSEVDEIGLDEQYLSPLIRSSKYIDGYDFRWDDWDQLRADGKEVWLLDPDELDDVPSSIDDIGESGLDNQLSIPDTATDETDDLANLLAYFDSGMKEYNLQDISILSDASGSTRPFWYRPCRRSSTRVLAMDNTQDRFRFILNQTSVRNINNLFGFYDIELDDTELKALLAFLNSRLFDDLARDYYKIRQGGLKQFSPNKLEQVPVIDPTNLASDVLYSLAETFDELCETARLSGDCDQVLDHITQTCLRELQR